MKILICKTYNLDSEKNPTEKAKVATSVKFFNVEKNQVCFPHQDFEIQFCLTLFNTNVYLCVSFAPKVKEIFKPKILMMVTKTFV